MEIHIYALRRTAVILMTTRVVAPVPDCQPPLSALITSKGFWTMNGPKMRLAGMTSACLRWCRLIPGYG